MPGFVDGYTRSRDHWQNRRSEAARAFAEFRQMHPNASYNDYRSFVDQITGGNSFLRGGIPSDQILQSLATEAQARQQREQMAQRLEMMRSQAQLAGTIGALAQNYAVQFENDAEVEDALVASLGGGDLARQQVRQLYSRGFSPIRERAKHDTIRQHLPTAIDILEANPDADLSSIFPEMPKPFLSSISTSAKEKLAEKQRLKIEEETNRLINQGKTMIDMGGPYTIDGFSSDAVNRARPVLDAYKAKLDTERQKAETEKRSETIRSTIEVLKADPGFQAQMAEPGFDLVSSLLTYLKGRGVSDLKLDELAPYIADLQDDSVAAKQKILREERAAQITALKETATVKHSAAAESLASSLGLDDNDKPLPLGERAGKYRAMASEAIKQIGLEYDLSDPTTVQSILRLIDEGYLERQGADPADFTSIVNVIVNDPAFRQSARTISSGNAAREIVADNLGIPEDVQTFASWATDYQASTRTSIEKAQAELVRPALEQGPNPDGSTTNAHNIDSAIAALEQLKTETLKQLMNAAKSSERWLLTGTGEFDIAKGKALAAERITAFNEMIEQLQARKQQATKSIEARANAANEAAKATREQEQKIQQGVKGFDPFGGNRESIPVINPQLSIEPVPDDPALVPPAIPPGSYDWLLGDDR